LEYGFLIGFPKTVESLTLLQEFKDSKEMLKVKNHQGAVEFPKDIEKYLIKELKKGAVVGPFHENPFDHGIIISPLNTVPKKDSLERCVILDLSVAGGTAVNESRLKEMLSVVVEWDNKQLASKREVQSLVETLNFAGSFVKPGRICISRSLNWLRSIYSVEGKVLVPEFVKKDIKWWKTFLPLFNGISMMMRKKWSKPDGIFTSDACLSGCGGMLKERLFHVEFPHSILDEHLHINALEMLSVIACLKMWGTKFKGKIILIKCDIQVTVYVINTGKSRNSYLQCCLREICFFSSYSRI
jgi:hypothetical protein